MQSICKVIAEIVQKHVELLCIDESLYEKSLTEMGVDSIKFVCIIVDLEEEFKIEIPDELLLRSELDTIHRMAEVVISRLGEDV